MIVALQGAELGDITTQDVDSELARRGVYARGVTPIFTPTVVTPIYTPPTVTIPVPDAPEEPVVIVPPEEVPSYYEPYIPYYPALPEDEEPVTPYIPPVTPPAEEKEIPTTAILVGVVALVALAAFSGGPAPRARAASRAAARQRTTVTQEIMPEEVEE